MLVLLPPSETKRPGGIDASHLELESLGFPRLTAARRAALDALVVLAQDPVAAATALRLGPKLAREAEDNARVRASPVLPAVDRYDGVLYDALDAGSLAAESRAFAHEHVAIASALFGLTRALDEIPAYRLSADSRVPGIRMKAHWACDVATELAERGGLILDLRSEAYAALGPIPRRDDAVYVRVVSDDGDRRRALNHFNKAGKGRLVRALLVAGIDHPDAESLLSWAAATGLRLERGKPGELELVV